MKYFKKMHFSKLLIFLICILLADTSYSQLVVEKGINEAALIETLIGSGVEVVPNSIDIRCRDNAYGAFSGETNVGIANGLIMTTGDAADAAGPNNDSRGNSNNFSNVEDKDLEELIPGFELLNVCVIEFSFKPNSDTLSFNFVFGSEEYSEFVDRDFNDVFGFFISGPGINGPYSRNAENIAVVPGTDPPQPISIQTINNGAPPPPYDYGEPIGPCTNCEYFIFNDDGNGFFNEESYTDETYIQYDGFTTVLTAGIAVQPCETYHIKLAIADSDDADVDSGVFIEGNSFSTQGVEITAGGYEAGANFPNAAAGCTNAKLTFTNTLDVDQERTIKYEIGGSARPGMDYESIPTEITFEAGQSEVELFFDILDDGIANEDRILEIYFEADVCGVNQIDTVRLTIEDFPVFSISEDQNICIGNEAKLLAENGFNYNWIDSSINNPSSPSQTVKPQNTTTYTSEIDYGRCNESLSTTITVTDCSGEGCPDPITEITTTSTDVCSGNYVSLAAVIDKPELANISWEGPIEITGGEFVASNTTCAPLVQTFTTVATCLSDPTNISTASIDITVYPTDISTFLNENNLGCTVGVFSKRLCSPYIEVSERQVFDTCSEGQAVFEVSYKLENSCIETFEYIVDYNCDAPYTVGDAIVNQAYVCADATPDISISDFSIEEEASLYYAFHNNSDIKNTGYTMETEIYGLSKDDLEEIVNNNIPCGQEIFVSPVIAKTMEDLNNLKFDEDCTVIGNAVPITFLCPIQIETSCVCDMIDNTFDMYASVSGGFPGLSNNALFTVSGDVFEGMVSHTEQFEVLSLPDSSSYEIIVEDEIGCTASFSETIFCSQKVPIELISFTGEVVSNGNYLKWSTATEINNDYFTIATSKDGINFEKLTTLSGNGNSNTPQYYKFLDRNTIVGTTYYQLLQTDFDGTTTIEGHIEIERREIGNNSFVINLFPNPVSEQLNLQFNQTNNQPINISLTNLLGKTVLTETYNALKGFNEVQLNTSNLSKGVYFLTIYNGLETHYQKLVKQ